MLQRAFVSRCQTNFCLLVARRAFISSHSTILDRKKSLCSDFFKTTRPVVSATKKLFSQDKIISGPLTEVIYDQVCEATLESLCDFFEDLLEQSSDFPDSDVSLGDGVLTIQFGDSNGTYVINRQRPNLQIWLSSPTSGPKRYDFINGQWIYKRDGISLHDILEKEIAVIVKKSVDLSQCAYAKLN